jgi:hypothetical protein
MSSTTLEKSTNAQVRRIQDEVEALAHDASANDLGDVVTRTAASVRNGTDMVREYSGAMAGGIRSWPVISFCVAAAIGFFVGRVTASRRRPAAH